MSTISAIDSTPKAYKNRNIRQKPRECQCDICKGKRQPLVETKTDLNEDIRALSGRALVKQYKDVDIERELDDSSGFDSSMLNGLILDYIAQGYKYDEACERAYLALECLSKIKNV